MAVGREWPMGLTGLRALPALARIGPERGSPSSTRKGARRLQGSSWRPERGFSRRPRLPTVRYGAPTGPVLPACLPVSARPASRQRTRARAWSTRPVGGGCRSRARWGPCRAPNGVAGAREVGSGNLASSTDLGLGVTRETFPVQHMRQAHRPPQEGALLRLLSKTPAGPPSWGRLPGLRHRRQEDPSSPPARQRMGHALWQSQRLGGEAQAHPRRPRR